jgi:hypothetical protein
MPVQELQNQQGGLGTVIGLVGGYLAGNPARKAKQAQQEIENKRNATNDAREAARDQDYHNEVTANIAKTTADTADKTASTANTQLQNGAYTTASNLLSSPEKGKDPVQWANSVWRRATQPIAAGGLGLTDPELQGKLYAQVQDIVGNAQKAHAAQFVGHENKLPSDPNKRLSMLLQRYAIERGIPGLDTKPTQQMIADTQRQIIDINNRAHQAVTENQGQQRINQGAQRLVIEDNRSRRGGSSNSDLSDRAQNIETQALGANVHDLKSALRIVEHANLPQRDYRRVRQDVIDQFKPAPVSHDVSGLSSMGAREYTRDDNAWKIKAQQDPDGAGPEPDPMDAKYEKKATVLNRPATNATPAPLPGNTPAPTRTPTPANKPGTGKTITRAEAIRLGGPDGVARAEALGYAVH